MNIEHVTRNDYPELLQLWEASVRATHHFLKEEDIDYLRPLILREYFDAVELRCARDEGGDGDGGRGGRILGFCGVAGTMLEMLFVLPEQRGCGIGAALCRHAIENMGVTMVDVNEQNPQAIGFYEHMGFRTVGRSAVDGQGKPFPLLHMELSSDSHRHEPS